MNFGQNVESFLKLKNIEAKRLCAEVNIAPNSVSTWKVRGTTPSAETAYAIARALGVTVEFLVDGDAGDAYVRKTLGIPEIPLEKRLLIKKILSLPESDIAEIDALVAVKAVWQEKAGNMAAESSLEYGEKKNGQK